jgi:hypothetical protein
MAGVFVVATVLRLSFAVPGVWQQSWTPHHADEHILPEEALALWEGVTPREVGWPASTTRLGLSLVYAVPFIGEQGGALRLAPNPEAALEIVSRYISACWVDPSPLFILGRWFSAFVGIAQVVLMAWALGRWLPSPGPAFGALCAAIMPLLVLYSQFILSDVTGVLFATAVLGLLPGAVPGDNRRAVLLGLFAGLAAASKFHFGLWLVPAVLVWWIGQGAVPTRRRLMSTAAVLGTFLIVLVLLVPWAWTQPVLMMKEFAGVVLVKAAGGPRGWSQFASNTRQILFALGWAVLLGLPTGVVALTRRHESIGLSVILVTFGGLALLAASAVVFDRYALLMAPGAVLVAAAGWQRAFDAVPASPRLLRPAAVAVFFVALLIQPVLAIQRAAQFGSYHQAHAWMLAHLPDRSRVVIFSEDNLFLPRTSEQLEACASGVWTADAYVAKWATNGVNLSRSQALPMRLAVLNDEFFRAFWCLRELNAARPISFVVERFHQDPRFDTLNVETMVRQFNDGLADPTRGFDAVLVHFPIATPVPPARVFASEVGPTLRLYLRPGLSLRGESGSLR